MTQESEQLFEFLPCEAVPERQKQISKQYTNILEAFCEQTRKHDIRQFVWKGTTQLQTVAVELRKKLKQNTELKCKMHIKIKTHYDNAAGRVIDGIYFVRD